MSRDYGKVRVQFWGDEKVRELAPIERYIALYALQSPHTNAIGCFRLPISYVAEDTGLDPATIEAAFEAIGRIGIARKIRGDYVWIPNYLRHNPPENPNVWRKCAKELQALPGNLGCIAAIADQLTTAGADKRMKTLGDDERSALDAFAKPFRNRFETVPERLIEDETTVSKRLLEDQKWSPPNLTYPVLTSPNQTEPSVAKATGADGASVVVGPTEPAPDPGAVRKDSPPANDGERPGWWPRRDKYGRVLGDIDEKIMFDVGKAVLGKSSGGQIQKMRAAYQGDMRAVVDFLLQAEEKATPAEWFAGVLNRAHLNQHQEPKHSIYPRETHRE